MIIAKPKIGTLFSIGIFVAFCLGISLYIFLILEDRPAQWYHYLIIVTLSPLALGLLTKTVLGYKKIAIGKERITINYPIRFSQRVYNLKDIESWTEQKVKTATGTFKELTVLFKNGKRLNMSFQEHSNYIESVKYLRKKCGKKYRDTN
ncbi:hypothetical protein FNH22_16685 [Fulvivirga sp. M361]|uniref:hypothetical protein n=1 Tax=Fulvivirga sp. M361 TaxID=2594266 RepID=UPI00117B541A|nr:hypothetical protein [Fulvivirga sp. M361]TRX56275.1 hypothetical protein FNH22_16685 [Fulvivirga sp. M361]